jgi:Flp pilus assembly secretin CpaC
MMNKKTVQILAILILAATVRAETVALNGNSGRKAESASVQLADGLIAPWGWKNVKEAVDGIAVRQSLTINYSALNSVQMDWLTTRNVVLESQRPLHWKVLLNEVLRGLEFGFIQNDAGVVEILPFEKYHAYKTEEAARILQNNHKTVEATFQRMALMDALTDVTRQAGISLNTGYLPLEICDPAAAKAAAEAAQAGVKKEKGDEPAAPVKVYETSFKTITPMEWRNVLKNILDPHGYDFVEMDGAVCPMETGRAQQMRDALLAAKPLIRQVVPIFYAKPTDMMARITELGVLSPRGKITLTQSAELNTKNEGTSTLRPRVREDLVVSDVEECVLQATEWIRKLDVTDGQVMIEARILAITDTDTKKRGVEWSGYENLLNLRIPTTTTTWDFGTTTKWDPQSPVGTAASAILTSTELKAALHMLDTLGNAEQLSHPLVVLGNRTEGRIDVQNKLQNYIIKRDQTDPTLGSAATRTYTVEWKETPIGLTLWVGPEISPDGQHVRLSVNQKMTDQLGTEPVIAVDPETRNPLGSMVQTTERILDTRAIVRDGDTLVVGGLVTTKNTVNDGKVPFLGSIPLLGRLFSYEDKIVVKENLVIMITPTILNEDIPATGYEPKSEAKANELSAKGTDYFYNAPVEEASTGQGSKVESLNVEGQGAEDGGRKTEDGDQGAGGVKPKEEIKLSEEAKLKPAAEPEVKESIQTLEAGK